ncbi:hypothetical protein SH668x_001232 [Planctomicrobium sp. SH668]|uniref:hypothetical protein n=1 Tax=Planctomicrobium sp. SH668 TaxID=3448126 RepID=UPI003F5C0A34
MISPNRSFIFEFRHREYGQGLISKEYAILKDGVVCAGLTGEKALFVIAGILNGDQVRSQYEHINERVVWRWTVSDLGVHLNITNDQGEFTGSLEPYEFLWAIATMIISGRSHYTFRPDARLVCEFPATEIHGLLTVIR